MNQQNDDPRLEELYSIYQQTRKTASSPLATPKTTPTATQPDRPIIDQDNIDSSFDSELDDIEKLYVAYKGQREPDHTSAIRNTATMVNDIVIEQAIQSHAAETRATETIVTADSKDAPTASIDNDTNLHLRDKSNIKHTLSQIVTAPGRLAGKAGGAFAELFSVRKLATGVSIAAIALFSMVTIAPLINSPSTEIADNHHILLNEALIASNYIQPTRSASLGITPAENNNAVPFQLGILATDISVALQAGNNTLLQTLANDVIKLASDSQLPAVLDAAGAVYESATNSATETMQNTDLRKDVKRLTATMTSANGNDQLYTLGKDSEALKLSVQLALYESKSEALGQSVGHFQQSADDARESLAPIERAIVDEIVLSATNASAAAGTTSGATASTGDPQTLNNLLKNIIDLKGRIR